MPGTVGVQQKPAVTKVWRRVALRADQSSRAPTPNPEGCHKVMGVVKKHLAEEGLSSPTLALCQVPHPSLCPCAPSQGW